MKFRIEHRFEGGPFERVVEFLTEEYEFEPTKLPNVKGNKKLVEEITEEQKYWKNEWCAHGQIPKLVQHIIQPKMLTWIEETTYDRKKKTFFTKITPFYMRGIFRCESKGYFIKLSDSEFLRVNDGFLEIRIPVFGPFIEEQIVAHLKGNFNEEFKVTREVVKNKFGNG